MNSFNKRIFTVFLFLTLFFGNSLAAEEISPQKSVENLLESIKGLKKGPALPEDQKKANETLKDQALAYRPFLPSGGR